jgi:hypothetical protein
MLQNRPNHGFGFHLCPGHKSWVPHISLVFREMWDTTTLHLQPSSFS